MMKIKIDNRGNLHIFRGNEFKRQYCPFDTSGNFCSCGDWCALFGEPYQDDITDFYKMDICKKTFSFSNSENIIDERKINE